MTRPVVVAYDGTPSADAAADQAAAEAVRRRLPLRIVHIPPPIAPTADGDTLIDELAHARVAAEQLLSPVHERLHRRHPRLAIDVEVVLGDAVQIMLREESEAAPVVPDPRHPNGLGA